MTYFDVFNGDADGIISLVQLRRAQPRDEAKLITGRKRDIKLLSQVDAKAGDHVTVLDISMRSNADDLARVLGAGANVFYADHHNAGDIPDHKSLTAMIDTSPEQCTAMLVDAHLEGSYRAWAVAAAFGDNFPALAKRKAQEDSQGQDWPLEKLERLGVLVNYNGYGAGVEDLHFHPADLYRHLAAYDTPMEFLDGGAEIFAQLDGGYEDDMDGARSAKIICETESGAVYVLSDSASSRRVSGVFGNALAQENPERAHAILTHSNGGYVVSVRAPLSRRTGADTLCLGFETGGGRSAAAGINALPESDADRFIEAFNAEFKF